MSPYMHTNAGRLACMPTAGLDYLATHPFHVRKGDDGPRRLCIPLPAWAMRAGPRRWACGKRACMCARV